MASIELLDTDLVYRNPKPHLVSRHGYFPSVARLGADELLVGLDIGSAFEAVDVRSYTCRSTDGGKTWSAPELIFTPDESQGPVSCTCRISSVGPGREVAGVVSLFDRSHPEEGLSNPATSGFVRTSWALVRSSDGGATWSNASVFPSPIDWNAMECCSAVVPLPSERWLIPTSTWPDWDGRAPHGHKAVVMISDDRGGSWKSTDVMNKPATAFWEQKQTRLSDGRLLVICWTHDQKQSRDLPVHYTFSRDNGDSYEPARTTELIGQTCTPIALPGNRVLCVYRRMDRKGLWAHLAEIAGDDWRPLVELPLWGTNVAAHGSTAGSTTQQMSSLRFGFPSLTTLADGSVFGVFWCVEDGISVIRHLRIGIG